MSKTLWITVLLFGFLLFGCATESLHENVNESWRGSSKEEIIDKFGSPEVISRDTLGNETYSYIVQGPTDSMKTVFTFNKAGKVTFVKLNRFIEDETQRERARMETERNRQMGEAIQGMSRGANPPPR